MGEEHAAALLEWAPNGDVDHLREHMDCRLESFAEKLRAEFHRDLRTIF